MSLVSSIQPRILSASGSRDEAVAAHLLAVPPAADPWNVAVLRRAAAQAGAQGSPAQSARYLRRALAEAPAAARADVLRELGIAEHNANEPAAVEHLSAALDLAKAPEQRTMIGLVLARAIWSAGQIVEAVTLLDSLIDEVDDHLAQPLEAELIAVARLHTQTRRAGLRRIAQRDPAETEQGAAHRLLASNVAFEHAVAATAPAQHIANIVTEALDEGAFLHEEGSENSSYYLAAWTLAQSDHFEEAERALDAGLELARAEGSIVGFARALNFRSNLYYRRGLLREAEADARDSLEYLPPARAPLVIAFLLDVLIEHHNLEPADEMLERFNLAGDLPEMILTTFVLERRGRLRIAQGHHEQALEDLLLCRRRSIEWGATSPAFLPWRSTLAMALHHLHRRGEAVELAAEEVLQAQEFGAARAFGAALRVQGLVSGGAAGLSLLERAASVLSGSGAPARTRTCTGRLGSRPSGRWDAKSGARAPARGSRPGPGVRGHHARPAGPGRAQESRRPADSAA